MCRTLVNVDGSSFDPLFQKLQNSIDFTGFAILPLCDLLHSFLPPHNLHVVVGMAADAAWQLQSQLPPLSNTLVANFFFPKAKRAKTQQLFLKSASGAAT